MKAKRGYRDQKSRSNIGRWLKRYFTKRTCKEISKPAEPGKGE